MATYFLDGISGSDANSGLSLANAFATPAKVESAWGSGDTCRVVGGQSYTLAGTFDMLNGSSLERYDDSVSNPVFDCNNGNFIAIGIDGVSCTITGIDCQNNTNQNLINLSNGCDGTIIQDLTVDNGAFNGIGASTSCSGTVTINRVNATNNGASATQQGDGIGQRGSSIFDCNNCYTSGNSGPGSSDGYTSHDTGAINLYDCVSENDGDGAHLTGSGDHTISNFVVLNPTQRALSLENGTCTVNGIASNGSFTEGWLCQSGGTLIVKNGLHITKTVDTGSSQAVYVTGEGSSLTLHNCTLVSYSTASGTSFRQLRANGASLTTRNVISFLDQSASDSHYHLYAPEGATLDMNYDMFNTDEGTRFFIETAAVSFSGFTSVGHGRDSLVDDPSFVSMADVDPSKSLARLSNNSAAINAGVDVGLPFNGSAPDMGSLEFSQNSPQPALTRLLRILS